MEKPLFERSTEKLIDIIMRHEILCLFCLVYLIYNINFRTIGTGDTIPASLLPFSILENHNLYLDQFYYYYAYNHHLIWFLREIDSHFLSSYPIVTPILVTAFYIIPYIFLNINNCPIDLFHPGFLLTVSIMEKLSASLIASISVIFVYLSLKELVSRRTAFIVALIFAFGTNTWAISSQALWQHGLVELLLAVSIFLVLLNEKRESNKLIIFLGILSGLFVFNRPIDSILLVPVIYYIFRLRDARIVYYICSAFLSGAPFLLYNLHYFGNFFGGYGTLLNGLVFDSEMITRLMGLLISPSRGLFIYTPVMLLSVLGYFKIFQISNKNIKNFLLFLGFSCLALVFVYSAFVIWWAGYSYGPRFLTGMLPALAVFLGLFIKDLDIKNGKNLFVIFVFLILLIWSVFVQFVGVFYYPNGNWDGELKADHQEKFWDWRDTQISRAFHAGMTSPLEGIKKILSIMTLVKTKDISKDGISLAKGWHGLEVWNDVSTRWMQADAMLAAFSPANRTANLTLRVLSFYRQRTLEIYFGDELAVRASVPTGFIEVTAPVTLAKGTNTVRLHVPEGCERPCDIKEQNNPDSRCLSIAVQDITIA